jgi:chorismate-pyruvate lyase
MQRPIELTKLSPFQRIILISNGTLTKLLEHLVDEQLIVIKLSESMQINSQPIAYLNLAGGETVIQRKICLQGQSSGIHWLYAESVIVPERLDSLFREDLLASQIPIGKLWAKHRVETFKELLPPFEEPAEQLAVHFNISPETKLLGRTYRVFSNRQPIMMLTEKFPAHYFTQLS